MLGQIVGAFIMIIVVVTLIPTINTELQRIMVEQNITGYSQTLLNLVPLIFAVFMIGIAIAMVVGSLRNISEFGDDTSEEDEEPEEKPVAKPHKQTYLEYVKERLTVEKLLKTGV